jgi:sensor histidine kinase YesM
MENTSQTVGNEGLYYVCYKLSSFGWNVLPTSRNAKVLRTLKDSKVPVGATLFYYLKKYSLEEVSDVFTRVFDITFSMAEKSGLLSRRTKHTVAIDCHEWFYYGKQIEGGFIVGKKPERGTLRCFKFITLDIVDKECRFTLLALPVLKSKDEQVTQVDLVKRLIDRALGKIKIWRVLIDRGFLGAEIINFLKFKGLEFIIPAKSSNKATVNSKLLEPNPVVVINGESMGNSKVNLIVVKEDGHRYGFFTNIEVGLDDDKVAMAIAGFYSKRWQIETGYRVKKYAFRGKTTSRKYIIRYIYFMLSIILYNFWILINGLLIFELNIKNDKPILSAKVFDAVLYKTRAMEDVT